MAKQRDMHGSAMQHLTKVNMDNSKIVMPPLAEQKTIASVLDTKCGEIDRLIETKRQKIETLKEYKKSVIYEAVTGKTDLRDS
jgi:type I restriction enzyme S subunit